MASGDDNLTEQEEKNLNYDLERRILKVLWDVNSVLHKHELTKEDYFKLLEEKLLEHGLTDVNEYDYEEIYDEIFDNIDNDYTNIPTVSNIRIKFNNILRKLDTNNITGIKHTYVSKWGVPLSDKAKEDQDMYVQFCKKTETHLKEKLENEKMMRVDFYKYFKDYAYENFPDVEISEKQKKHIFECLLHFGHINYEEHFSNKDSVNHKKIERLLNGKLRNIGRDHPVYLDLKNGDSMPFRLHENNGIGFIKYDGKVGKQYSIIYSDNEQGSTRQTYFKPSKFAKPKIELILNGKLTYLTVTEVSPDNLKFSYKSDKTISFF
jgi:hypothetical protein